MCIRDRSGAVAQYGSAINNTVTQTVISALRCPSDNAGSNGVATAQGNRTKHNYVVNAGNTNRLQADYNQVVFGGAPFVRDGRSTRAPTRPIVRFKDIPDGLSKTLMAAEILLGSNDGTRSDLRGFTWWGPGAVFNGLYQPNTTQSDQLQLTAHKRCTKVSAISAESSLPYLTFKSFASGPSPTH